MRRQAVVIGFVAALSWLAAHGGGAWAQPTDARADEDRIARAEAAFKKGVAAFDAGSLDKALAYYRESYAMWPRARTLLNLGLVTRRLGRPAEAANLFAQYLDDDAADEARVPAVRKALSELDQEVGRLVVTSVGETASAEVLLDGVVVASTELGRPYRVLPGAHRLQQGAFEIEVEVERGQEVPVELGKREAIAAPTAPGPAEAPPPPVTIEDEPTPPASGGRRWYLWAAVPTALAGGATVYFALRHRSDKAELDDILAEPTMHDYTDAVDARDRAKRTALYTNLGLAATGVGVVATGVLFLLRPRHESPRPSLSLAPGHAALAVSGTW